MVFGDRMFYHVAIMTHSHSTKLEKECNLTKEEVRIRFGEPYENGSNLFINGTVKKHNDIERIKVFSTNFELIEHAPTVKDGDISWDPLPEVTKE